MQEAAIITRDMIRKNIEEMFELRFGSKLGVL